MMRKICRLFPLLFMLISSCSQASTVIQSTYPPPLDSATAPAPASATAEMPQTITTKTPSITPVPSHVSTSAPTGTDLPSIDLKAEINHAARTVAFEETVRYRNLSAQALAEIVLIAEPNRYPGGFNLLQVEIQNWPSKPDYELGGNLLTLELAPALGAGEEIQFFLRFELTLPPIPPPSDMLKPQPYGFTERQMNLVDWYLFIPPLSPDGEWLAHKPSYFGEFLVYPAADYRVEIILINAPADILVAASAGNQSVESGKYRYELRAARTFALSLNSGYEMVETNVRGVTIRSYFAGYDRAAGEATLGWSAEALELYSDLYGAYPRDTLSVVEADFLDGMEFDGLYFLSKAFYNLYDGTPKGYLTFIAVHETAHQWFFSQVGNDQALEPWLDEAWCTFSELLYLEHYHAELVEWWWYFRVDLYEPSGMIDLPVYDYTGFAPYRNAVYLRGAQFLVELRDLLGEEQFIARARSYLQANTGDIASTASFFQAFGLDWQTHAGLLGKYFRSPPAGD